MSILIKGMEMPKKCGECLLAKLSPTGESLICDYMLSSVSWEERPFDCPLVHVPPHGRLGDLDKLGNDFRHMAKYQRGERQQGILWCCETIRLAPTIIPAEEGE